MCSDCFMASFEIGKSMVESNVSKADETEQKMVLDGVKLGFVEWQEEITSWILKIILLLI